MSRNSEKHFQRIPQQQQPALRLQHINNSNNNINHNAIHSHPSACSRKTLSHMHKKFDCQGINISSHAASNATTTTTAINQHFTAGKDFIRTSNAAANESDNLFRQNLLLNNKFFLAHTSNFYSSRVLVNTFKPSEPHNSFTTHQKYENVCFQCSGGVPAQNLSASDGCLRSKCALCAISNVQDVGTPVENIYEDICEQCNTIYSGSERSCEKCSLASASTVKLNKSRLFTGLLSSFRGKTNKATGKPPVKPPQKPVIVHNVDVAYKTNQSFDLDEICRLKAKSSTSHIYGKLRKSDDNLLWRRPDAPTEERLIKSAVSESNFGQWQPELNSIDNSSSAKQLYQNSDTFIRSSESSVVDAIDDDISANSSRRNSVSSVSSTINNNNNSSTKYFSAHNINDSAVIAWMTSLSKYTVDYADECLGVCMVKCIPSNSFASCCGVSGSLTSVVRARIQFSKSKYFSMRIGQQSTADLDRQVDEFKFNIMENSSKRQGIYIKETKHEFEPIYLVVKDSFLDGNAVTAGEHILRPHQVTSSTYQPMEECFLRPKNVHLQQVLAEERVPTTIIQLDHQRTQSKLKHSRSCNLEAIRQQRNRMTVILISMVGLNKWFQLTFNDKQLYVLLYQLSSANDNQSSKFYNHYNKYLKHLISLLGLAKQFATPSKTSPRHRRQLPSCDNSSQIVETAMSPSELHKKSKISDFEVKPCSGGNNKREINDFVVKLQRRSPLLRPKIEDFEKSNVESTPLQQLIRRQAKMLSDFELQPKTVETMTNGQRPEQMSNNNNHLHCRMQPHISNDYGDSENIYQPIWKFRTVGYASEESYATGGELVCDDGLVTECSADDDSDGAYSLCDSHEYFDELGTLAEWEVAEEFRYATKFEDCKDIGDLDRRSTVFNDPYQKICVLYSVSDPKHNRLIYDNCQPLYSMKSASDLAKEYSYEFMEKNARYINNINGVVTVAMPSPSVQAWKKMLRSISYMDDEEDVNLPENFKLNNISLSTDEEATPSPETKSIPGSPLMSNNEASTSAISLSKSNSSTSVAINIPVSPTPPSSLSTTPSKSKKDISHLLEKLQSGSLDINQSSSGFFDKKNEACRLVLYKHNPDTNEGSASIVEQVVSKPVGHAIYGVELNELEKDEQNPAIPRFVVECVKIIESVENLTTNGIYRASGKKDSIDKLRKKMNETKSKKGTKYACLKDEDVHTITGALKQFFRELKTDLIPMNIIKNLPSDLEAPSSLPAIRDEMEKIDVETKELLKYILRHLITVDANNSTNLMTASNLSIVWGACIFTSSVTSIDTFETSELMKKNTLIKVLIQCYNDVFELNARAASAL